MATREEALNRVSLAYTKGTGIKAALVDAMRLGATPMELTVAKNNGLKNASLFKKDLKTRKKSSSKKTSSKRKTKKKPGRPKKKSPGRPRKPGRPKKKKKPGRPKKK